MKHRFCGKDVDEKYHADCAGIVSEAAHKLILANFDDLLEQAKKSK